MNMCMYIIMLVSPFTELLYCKDLVHLWQWQAEAFPAPMQGTKNPQHTACNLKLNSLLIIQCTSMWPVHIHVVQCSRSTCMYINLFLHYISHVYIYTHVHLSFIYMYLFSRSFLETVMIRVLSCPSGSRSSLSPPRRSSPWRILSVSACTYM